MEYNEAALAMQAAAAAGQVHGLRAPSQPPPHAGHGPAAGAAGLHQKRPLDMMQMAVGAGDHGEADRDPVLALEQQEHASKMRRVDERYDDVVARVNAMGDQMEVMRKQIEEIYKLLEVRQGAADPSSRPQAVEQVLSPAPAPPHQPLMSVLGDPEVRAQLPNPVRKGLQTLEDFGPDIAIREDCSTIRVLKINFIELKFLEQRRQASVSDLSDVERQTLRTFQREVLRVASVDRLVGEAADFLDPVHAADLSAETAIERVRAQDAGGWRKAQKGSCLQKVSKRHLTDARKRQVFDFAFAPQDLRDTVELVLDDLAKNWTTRIADQVKAAFKSAEKISISLLERQCPGVQPSSLKFSELNLVTTRLACKNLGESLNISPLEARQLICHHSMNAQSNLKKVR